MALDACDYWGDWEREAGGTAAAEDGGEDGEEAQGGAPGSGEQNAQAPSFTDLKNLRPAASHELAAQKYNDKAKVH